MEREESNRVIAEFMGVKPIAGKNNNRKVPLFWIKLQWYTEKDLRYHLEFNWLMPVIEKIEDLGFDTTMKPNELFIWDKDESPLIDCEFGETKLEAAYKAVVEFIQWYNEQALGK